MANFSSVRNSSKKKSVVGGIVKFKFVVEKLQKRLILLGRNKEGCDSSNSSYVPEDVKEGHFAVIAEGGGEEQKRFVLPLSCLTNPTFLKLLEQAEEEYGFDHEGAVTIPCRPCELERILLAHQWHQEGTCRKSLILKKNGYGRQHEEVNTALS
ncbi:hypothetical protein JHK87_034169 [Glycine soja]|nr:hypothetical protein JHK87_034169 [Glycine soja]